MESGSGGRKGRGGRRRKESDLEVAKASYPFLVEGAAERWLVLICNNLSFGQAELARALVRQLAAVEPATAHALLRRLAFHGLPSLAKWYHHHHPHHFPNLFCRFHSNLFSSLFKSK
jgi:hypothetical protein